jgi:hypothetical protein
LFTDHVRLLSGGADASGHGVLLPLLFAHGKWELAKVAGALRTNTRRWAIDRLP